MKRISALLMLPALALALAGCGGSDAPPPGGPTASATASSVAPDSESPAPSPSTGSETSGPTPSASTTPNPEAAVISQWGGDTEGSPVLWFAESGTYNGNDGCNTLMGQWTESGGVVTLSNTTMTLMACPGKDTWLSGAASVRLEADTLHVEDKDGEEIGTLPRINVAG